MGIANTKSVGTRHSEQNILNTSFDEDFGVLAVETLSYNPISGDLERTSTIQGNPSFAFEYTDGNLTKITKTIGSISYEQTLTYSSGDLVTMSAWSEV